MNFLNVLHDSMCHVVKIKVGHCYLQGAQMFTHFFDLCELPDATTDKPVRRRKQ